MGDGALDHPLGHDDAFEALLAQCWLLVTVGDSTAALGVAESMERQADAAASQSWVARIRGRMAWLCLQLGQAARGLAVAERALADWPPSLWPEERVTLMAVRAWLLLEVGDIEPAVDAASAAAELAGELGDLRTQSFTTNVLGVIFWGGRLLEGAIRLCNDAVRLAEATGDRTYQCWWLINLGGATSAVAEHALEVGETKRADEFFYQSQDVTRRALDLARSLGDTWAERICLANLADTAVNFGHTESAETWLEQYRALGGTLPPRSLEHYLDVWGTVLVARGRHAEALSVLQEARSVGELSGNLETLVHAALHLSMSYEGLGRHAEALAEFKTYHRLHGRLSAEHVRQAAQLAGVKFETDRLRRAAAAAEQRAEELARSYGSLVQLAATLAASVDLDALTGVFNRRRMETEFELLATRPRRYVVAMVDIDRFKQINDAFGHRTGDYVLKQVGRTLSGALSANELVFRYGGEEFALVLEDMPPEAVVARLDGIRRSLAEGAWHQLADGLRVTVSIGAARWSERSQPLDVLHLADERLYAAKGGGRNRVSMLTVSEAPVQRAG